MNDETRDQDHPGIGRLNYFLSKLALGAVIVALVFYFGPESSAMRFIGFAAMMAGFVLDVMRLQNIGLSKWYAMLRLIPYLGSLLEIGLLSAQPGWIETRRFDRSGKIVIALYAALIVLLIYLAFKVGVAPLGLI